MLEEAERAAADRALLFSPEEEVRRICWLA
jgi:hypothetical protein